MPSYRLGLSREAEKVLTWMAKREPELYERVSRALDNLEEGPFQGKPLKGQLKGRYSYRVGSCQILYVIHRHQLLAIVIDIGHRRDIYR